MATKSKDGLTAWGVLRLLFPEPERDPPPLFADHPYDLRWNLPALLELLAGGSWYVTGFRTPFDPNKDAEHIPAHLWNVLDLHFNANIASGGGLEYHGLRFYESDGIVEPPEPAEAERQQIDRRQRTRDVEAEALLENRINAVKAKAKSKWPDPQDRPGINQMARLLVEGQPKRKVADFSEEAIRKILAGTYKPAKVRSIPGLSSG